jgi:hypothetical protein
MNEVPVYSRTTTRRSRSRFPDPRALAKPSGPTRPTGPSASRYARPTSMVPLHFLVRQARRGSTGELDRLTPYGQRVREQTESSPASGGQRAGRRQVDREQSGVRWTESRPASGGQRAGRRQVDREQAGVRWTESRPASGGQRAGLRQVDREQACVRWTGSSPGQVSETAPRLLHVRVTRPSSPARARHTPLVSCTCASHAPRLLHVRVTRPSSPARVHTPLVSCTCASHVCATVSGETWPWAHGKEKKRADALQVHAATGA